MGDDAVSGRSSFSLGLWMLSINSLVRFNRIFPLAFTYLVGTAFGWFVPSTFAIVRASEGEYSMT
jgi:hypothetical protein